MEEVNEKLESLSDDKYLCMLYDKEKELEEMREYDKKIEIEESKKEQKKIIAKRMLNMNMSIDQVSKCTDLSVEEVNLLVSSE